MNSQRIDIVLKRLFGMPINYVGNKKKLLERMLGFLEREKVQFSSVLDAFSGSGVVSLILREAGKEVFSNDALAMSALATKCLMEYRDFPLSQEDIVCLCSQKNKSLLPLPLDGHPDLLLPEEIDFLKNFRQNVAFSGIASNVLELGLDILNNADRTVLLYDNPATDNNRNKSIFAMHLMCNHILQRCFRGGRYYNGQTLSRVDKRVGTGKKDECLEEDLFGQAVNSSETIVWENTIIHNPMASLWMSEKEKLFRNELRMVSPKFPSKVFNCDVIKLLESGVVCSDMVYLDPPYGGDSSDYAFLYGVCEEYIHGKPLSELDHISGACGRFKTKTGYKENFDAVLDLCKPFKVWLISFNESSFATIDDIASQVRKFRSKVVVEGVGGYRYNYRKASKSSKKETEFFLLATE